MSRYLLQKSKGRENVGEVNKSRFRSEEILSRSNQEYSEIADRLEAGASLPQFEVAYGKLLELVDLLDIPE